MPFIASMFSPPKSPSPPPPPVVMPAPTRDNAAVEAAMEKAAADQRRAAQLARGRASTFLTGGEGVVSKAPVKLKAALGE